MKKFQFSLETVKKYKENILEDLKNEYGQCMLAVQRKEEEIGGLEHQSRKVSAELNQRNSQGISPTDIQNYQRYLHVMRNRIQQENKKLDELKHVAEKKKEEMITAKMDVEIFAKLKEKQLEEYLKVDAKAQELFAEEFVTRGFFLQASANRG